MSLEYTWIAGKHVGEEWLYTCSNSSRTLKARDHNVNNEGLGSCLILFDPFISSDECLNENTSLCEGNFKYT